MSLPPVPIDRKAIRPARAAIYLAFFNLGAGSGLWAVFIPIVRERLQIGEGVLGLALLAIAVGALIAMPVTGWAIARFGAHAISAHAAMVMPIAATLPLLAPSLALLFFAGLVMGAAMGTLDVSMNNEAARVEAVNGRPLMSGFHGLYSIGGLAGAGIGALLVGLESGAAWAAWAAAGVLVVLAIAASLVRTWYLPGANRAGSVVRFTLPSGALIGLGILAFLSFGLEGAVADWSAVFLTEEKSATPALAAAGYAAFAGAMAVMRFLGDRLVLRFGRQRALALGGLVIAAGGAVAVLAPWPLLSAFGFGLVGIGAANVVPVLLSTAARFPAGSGGVSAVSTIGYLGTLSWPPIIGGIAHTASLWLALWLIALAGVAIASRASLVRPGVGETPPGA